MKCYFVFGFILMTMLVVSVMETTATEENTDGKIAEERGYCAEKNIKCDNIHCCTGLKCIKGVCRKR
nr:Lt_55 precursor [Lachesana tarabaevi]